MGFAGFGRSLPIEQRSERALKLWIVGFPLLGVGMAAWIIVAVVSDSANWTITQWLFNVGWFGIVALVLGIGLPAVARKELDRRKREAQTIAENGKRLGTESMGMVEAGDADSSRLIEETIYRRDD